ncbi:MAG: hypothetical protein NTW99_10840 [Chloroflexi bacterium]|nr:hypothetical protein [Chloroflexota bacterium]
MIETNPIDLAKSIDYWDLLTYIKQFGWSQIDDKSSRFIVFSGLTDINDKPIEIVFLRNETANEQPIYIANALSILSSVAKTEPSSLAQDINTVNRDVLRMKIQGSGVEETIPLRSAAQQIYELKQVVAYAARSEIDRKPYYIDAQVPIAKAMVEAYRFGHTFRGSFGFTIETPKLQEIHTYKQLDLFPDFGKSTPMWRKVMERIARGLTFADQATRERDSRLIIDNYTTGLNANMCQSLANMYGNQNIAIEFSIKWAPIQLPENPAIQSFKSVQLSEAARNQLAFAAKVLVETHQEEVTVLGRIVELSAKSSPLDMDTSRTVRIQWFEEAEGRAHEATATLNPDDYQKAIEAHRNWYVIQITGILSNKKDNWRFVNYSKFDISPTITEQS